MFIFEQLWKCIVTKYAKNTFSEKDFALLAFFQRMKLLYALTYCSRDFVGKRLSITFLASDTIFSGVNIILSLEEDALIFYNSKIWIWINYERKQNAFNFARCLFFINQLFLNLARSQFFSQSHIQYIVPAWFVIHLFADWNIY